MSGPIDAYLAALRDSLRRQPDTEDLVAEIADHLHETAEQLIARGRQQAVAEEAAILRLGEPALVARALVSARTRTLAVPTRFTVAVGHSSLVAAVAWVVAAAATTLTNEAWLNLTDGPLATIAAGSSTLGTLLLVVLVAGLAARSGGRRDPRTISAVALALLFALTQVAMPWLLPLVGAWLLVPAVLLAVGTSGVGVWLGLGVVQLVLLSTALGLWTAPDLRLRAGAVAALLAVAATLAVRWGTNWRVPGLVWLVLAWPLSTTAILALQGFEVGPLDSYSERPVAGLVGIGVGCLLTALGCALLGRRLATEVPVPGPVVPATT